jgi:hypothetical protein
MVNTLEAGLTQAEQDAIVRAALLAEDGLEGLAEATRFAAGYHNLSNRKDADGPVQADRCG